MFQRWVQNHKVLAAVLVVVALVVAGVIAVLVSRPSTGAATIAPSQSASKSAKPSAPPVALSNRNPLYQFDKSKLTDYPSMPGDYTRSGAKDTSPVAQENKDMAVSAVKAYYPCDGQKPRAAEQQSALEQLWFSPQTVPEATTSECASMLANSPQYTNDVRQVTRVKYMGVFGALFDEDILQIQVTFNETRTYAGASRKLVTEHMKNEQTTMYVFLAHQQSNPAAAHGVQSLMNVEQMGI